MKAQQQLLLLQEKRKTLFSDQSEVLDLEVQF